VRLRRFLLGAYVSFALAFLLLPVAIIVLFSFNSGSNLSFPLRGLSFSWYGTAFHDPKMVSALENSLIVGAGMLVVVALVGTPAAWAIARYRFRGRGLLVAMIVAPVGLPGLFVGAALLTFFASLHVHPSLRTVVVAHGVYTLGFFVVIAAARFSGLDSTLEEAAWTLGAGRLAVARLVVWPLVRPALFAALALCLALSLDEFVITFFVIGPENTLPIVIFSNVRTVVTPEINAIATILLLASWLSVGAAALLIQGGARRRRVRVAEFVEIGG
jgi:spermidine/putrescine transport system permease protein